MTRITVQSAVTWAARALAAILTICLLWWLGGKLENAWYSVTLAVLSALVFLLAFYQSVPAVIHFLTTQEDACQAGTSRATWIRLATFLLGWLLVVNVLLVVGIGARHPGESIIQALYTDYSVGLDFNNYQNIAAKWYEPLGNTPNYSIVFFPMYPIVVRLLTFGARHYFAASLAVSNFCAFASGLLMYKLARLDYDEKTALRAVFFLFVFPAAYFFAVPMTESLFLLLTLAYLYALRKRDWVYVFILGVLAALTRSHGLVLLVPAFIEWLRETLTEKKGRTAAVTHLLAISGLLLGFGCYLYINYSIYGNPFQFQIYQQQHWYQQMGFFWNTTEYLFAYARQYFPSHEFWSLSVPNITVLALSLGALLAGAKRLRPSYLYYGMAYFAFSYGATWLLSGPRYMACLAVLPLVPAVLSENKRVFYVLAGAYVLAFAAYFCMFLLKWHIY